MQKKTCSVELKVFKAEEVKNISNTLFIAYDNNEGFHFVVRVGSPALISFYCVCFVSFYFFLFFLFFLWILLLPVVLR